MHTGAQQVSLPLLAQSFFQQVPQNQQAESNNNQATNTASVGSDGDRPLNWAPEVANTCIQITQLENSLSFHSRPENNRQQSETGAVFVPIGNDILSALLVTSMTDSPEAVYLPISKTMALQSMSLRRSRNDDCYAMVTIECKYKGAIESDDFEWPTGVYTYCTYWKTNNRRPRQSERRNRK